MFSYLSNHWRGLLPLGVSWWLNCALLSVLLVLLTRTLAGPAERASIASTGEFLLFAVLLLVAGAVIPTWQVVGLWRAAERHEQRLQRKLRAHVAVVVATIFMLWLIARGLGLIGDWTPVAQMALNIGPYRANLVEHPGQRELEIRGGFGIGLGDRVERELERNPSIRRLRLNSKGGSWVEARKLERLIWRHGLNTYSTQGCHGACVLAFIGGHHRYLARGADLGLQVPPDPWRQTLINSLTRQNAPPWFIARLRARGAQVWFPSQAELRASGVVHTVLGELPRRLPVYGSETGNN